MKVAYLLGSLNRGGTETLMLDLCRKHTIAPFEMVMIHRKTGVCIDDFQQSGVPVIHLPIKKGRYVSYLWQLRKTLIHNNVTIVHAQLPIDAFNAIIATKGTPIKVVATFHGFYFLQNKRNEWLNKFVLTHLDAACFVSAYEREYYTQHYGLSAYSDKLHVVYNGINFDKLDVQYAIPDFLKPSDPPQAGKGDSFEHTQDVTPRIRMAMVGNFVSVRSQSFPCMSIQLLREKGITNFDFYFIGKRNEAEPWRYDDCVRYCEEHNLTNVHFLGGRSDVPAILQHIDAFVYSTDHDTFGIAVVEAMAAGLPVFVNDWAVMREVLTQSGYAPSDLWQTQNADSLATMIENYLQNPEPWQIKAQHAQKQSRATFSIERHLELLTAVYAAISK